MPTATRSLTKEDMKAGNAALAEVESESGDDEVVNSGEEGG